MRLFVACAVAAAGLAEPQAGVAERVMKLTRESIWKPAGSIPVQFRTWHPQGLVRIADAFFVSSVEVRSRERGDGVGHLFKIDKTGRLLADLILGDGPIFHPGGIDYDGTNIWVPTAEYRPDSRSIVYRVDPGSMKATEVFRFADHLGAIVHDTSDETLHAVSWGSRRLYAWKVGNERAAPVRTTNQSHYVDYQDCKSVGGQRMLCTGVTEIRQTPQSPPFRLGGIEIVDLVRGQPMFQVPVLLWTAGGLAMTQNPVWLEQTTTGLRGYFMPEDDTSTIYIYDVETN
jgi:hypothetical protein